MKAIIAILLITLAGCSTRPNTPVAQRCEKVAERVADARYHWQDWRWLDVEQAIFAKCMRDG